MSDTEQKEKMKARDARRREENKAILFNKLLTLPPENPFWENTCRFTRPVFTQESRYQRGVVTQPKIKPENMSDEVFAMTRDLHFVNFVAWLDAQPSHIRKAILLLGKLAGCRYV